MADGVQAVRQCDIIMKGGLTSGVVYPKTILRLMEQYEFRSIGGTSAGAIAAALTAAAEYNRAGGGFKVVEKLPDELPGILESLFQATSRTDAVFKAVKLAFLDGKRSRAIVTLLCGYKRYFVLGSLVGLALAAAALFCLNAFAAALALVIAAVGGALLLAYGVVKQTLRALKDQDFGLCPGRTQNPNGPQAISDWLADKIELAAGRMAAGGAHPTAPLTFGDARHRKLDLRMMTTNLSVGRPHTLPDMDKNHYFKEDEFRKLFPDWIVDYLIRTAKGFKPDPKRPVPEGYLPFPVGDAMPLVVAARMSLSFPILFSTVPLYRKEFPLRSKGGGEPPIERMLFSDGGLSSNFPVHFFDALLPTRPTFGISLEEFDKRRPDRRVDLSVPPLAGQWLDGQPIETLGAFAMSLINSAKDWQDKLQSTLPGYRERIASAFLTEEEGGLNLNMDKKRVENLIDLGDRAGGLLTGRALKSEDKTPFDFREHRWRRFLIAFARLEESLEAAARVWGKRDDASSLAHFIADYMEAPRNYKPKSKEWGDSVFKRFDEIMQLAQSWPKALRLDKDSSIPKPESNMRITPIP